MPGDPLDEHFLRPRNAGKLESADLSVAVENPVCGDLLKLQVRREGGRIAEARFQVYGCPAAISAGSVLTELLGGKGLDELEPLVATILNAALGELVGGQAHAAVLARDALEALLREWRRTQ